MVGSWEDWKKEKGREYKKGGEKKGMEDARKCRMEADYRKTIENYVSKFNN